MTAHFVVADILLTKFQIDITISCKLNNKLNKSEFLANDCHSTLDACKHDTSHSADSRFVGAESHFVTAWKKLSMQQHVGDGVTTCRRNCCSSLLISRPLYSCIMATPLSRVICYPQSAYSFLILQLVKASYPFFWISL